VFDSRRRLLGGMADRTGQRWTLYPGGGGEKGGTRSSTTRPLREGEGGPIWLGSAMCTRLAAVGA
jgi:hypothetical protein